MGVFRHRGPGEGEDSHSRFSRLDKKSEEAMHRRFVEAFVEGVDMSDLFDRFGYYAQKWSRFATKEQKEARKKFRDETMSIASGKDPYSKPGVNNRKRFNPWMVRKS